MKTLEPFNLPYHESSLVIERQRHTCPILLDTKQLWHWGKWKSWPASRRHLDHDIDPLGTVHYADLKPLVNSYIQQLVQVKWDVAVHGRDLYLLKPTLGRHKKFKHLTRAEEVVITRLGIVHTRATKSHILSLAACHHCGQTDHWPYAPGMCSVAGKSWRILHRWLIEYSIWDKSRDLHSGIPARSSILLSDMNGQTY